jgi:hypothetical protein
MRSLTWCVAISNENEHNRDLFEMIMLYTRCSMYREPWPNGVPADMSAGSLPIRAQRNTQTDVSVTNV